MPRVRCPQCQTVVDHEPNTKPVCPSCGFGAKKPEPPAAPQPASPATFTPSQGRPVPPPPQPEPETKRKYRWGAAIVGGLLTGFVLSVLFGWMNLASDDTSGIQAFGFFAGLIGFGALFLYSEHKAWGRAFLTTGLLALFSPIAILIGGSAATSRAAEEEGGAAAAGTAIGTGLGAIFFGFIAFFFALIFLISSYFAYKRGKEQLEGN